ncbi:MAG TPA: peptide deformylase [Thermoleophilaceae bacterium]|nr:peptide deformylase [Thermoleophilaceae bacterium]
MAVRDVLRYPHPALKTVAEPAQLDGSEDTERAARDLLDTMRSFGHCVGLAATQLGDLTRIVVVDVSEHPKAKTSHGLLLLANPRVVAEDGTKVAREGCLSIPHLTANVRRATQVTIEADAIELTDAGLTTKDLRIDTDGFEARCLLHEIDHLDGILFLDRVDSLTRDVFPRKNYS